MPKHYKKGCAHGQESGALISGYKSQKAPERPVKQSKSPAKPTASTPTKPAGGY